MKRTSIFLALGLVLLCAGLVFAGDGPGFVGKMKAAIPVATAIFGFAGGVLALLPKVVKIQKAIHTAKTESLRVKKKYKGLLQNDIQKDYDNLLRSYDEVLERVADLLVVLRMKNAARTLRGLL